MAEEKTVPEMGVAELAAHLAAGDMTAEDAVATLLAHIGRVDPEIEAWAHLDEDHALAQARLADEFRRTGRPVGPLHGVPVGIKDIIDTEDLPTECGTPLMAGRECAEDAALVAQLRAAGAIVMGKTVTTELAVFHPGKTRNPHDGARTPGGSSSGSAAAVASGMVPAAVGTQTNGSVIRPASYCGVVGFKPTLGTVSRIGVNPISPQLDTIGVFGRTVEDTARVAECMTAYDPRDASMRLHAARRFSAVAGEAPPLAPVYAFVRTAVWDEADADVEAGFAELVDHLGEDCDEVTLPPLFDDALERHRAIMLPDLAKSFAPLYGRGKDRLSDVLCGMIEDGRRITALDYAAAHDWIEVLNAGLDEIFDRYDAIITPAASGEAPPIDTTGSPNFCTLWTLCGTPSVSLPLLQGTNGLPIGVQVIGRRGDDARLLRTARCLMERTDPDDG